jgi:putative SOS response-associated peptidase YedK
MYQKLSNRASVSQIEKEFDLRFLYPEIYTPIPIIDGSRESILPIITNSEDAFIQFGIWGILPEHYDGSRKSFQKIEKTLHISDTTLFQNESIFFPSLEKNRCLIIVSGFFTYTITDGLTQPYYVHLPNHQPFSLAGIYNTLNDGFITCSFLLTPVKSAFHNIPNVQKMMPLVIPSSVRDIWLSKETPLCSIQALMDAVEPPYFNYYALSGL